MICVQHAACSGCSVRPQTTPVPWTTVVAMLMVRVHSSECGGTIARLHNGAATGTAARSTQLRPEGEAGSAGLETHSRRWEQHDEGHGRVRGHHVLSDSRRAWGAPTRRK